MFHRLASEQIEKFAAEGITVSAANVVRLNDAAAELAAAKSDGGPVLDAPRCRWCGGVLLREPTIQSEMWMVEVASELARDDESWAWMMAFALVHADEPGFFDRDEMRAAKSVSRACRQFQRRLAASEAELWAAVRWCRREDEARARARKQGKADVDAAEAERTYRARMWADLAEAVALTGCGPNELKAMTPRMLDSAIRTAWEREGRQFRDAGVAAKTRAWYETVNAVRAESVRE